VSTDPHRGPAAPAKPVRPLAPDDLRAATFERAPFGRRGYDEYAVGRYLHRVAGEIAVRDDAIDRLLHENDKLKHSLREWHRQMVGYDGVDLVALAQQEIEQQIAQTEQYSREREEEAARLYDEILAEAHERADEVTRSAEAAAVATEARSSARSPGLSGLSGRPAAPDPDQLARQRTFVMALLQALEALATQVDATRRAFSVEVDKLDILGVGDVAAVTGPVAVVPDIVGDGGGDEAGELGEETGDVGGSPGPYADLGDPVDDGFS
jgi:DivIVA domain-containing protein